jgi:hypothetical protein
MKSTLEKNTPSFGDDGLFGEEDRLGADKLAEKYAKEKNIPIQVIAKSDIPERTSSEYTTTERTYSIVNQAQLVVAFWNGKAKEHRIY